MSAATWIILGLAGALVAAVLLACYFWRRSRTAGVPSAQVDAQLEVERARAEARALVAAQGAAVARQMVLTQYQTALDALTAAQVEQAKKLEEDPVALADFLVQAGRTTGKLLLALLVCLLAPLGGGQALAQDAQGLALGPVEAAVEAPVEPVCDPGDARKCSAPMQAGQRAPYAGQLLTPKLAVDLGQRAQGCDARMELAVKFSQDSAQVDLQLEKSLRENDARAAAEREKILRDALDEARARPWYTHPAFVVITTVVLTLGLVVAVGYALPET